MIPPFPTGPDSFDPSLVPLWPSLLAPGAVIALILCLAIRVWRLRPGRNRREYIRSCWSPMLRGDD